MIVNDEGRRPEDQGEKSAAGWTTLHSWIFLAIVAFGLVVVAMQNRYHYLSPLGLGKAYRIDKVFGSIQEFDPGQGWVKAQLEAPPQSVSMLPPYGVPGSPNVPGSAPSQGNNSHLSIPGAQSLEGTLGVATPREREEQTSRSEVAPQVTSQPQSLPKAVEMSPAEKFASFKKEFPDFAKDEYQLANDDLYPDWKANVNPKGTWKEFLAVYRDFIQWWNDAGSPPEPGFKLWKDFLKSRR